MWQACGEFLKFSYTIKILHKLKVVHFGQATAAYVDIALGHKSAILHFV